MSAGKVRGFTLIELLVVISIIGFLSSVVIASLNGARSKAKDTAVKAQLQDIRKQAEIIFSNNGCYAIDGPTCSTLNQAVCSSTNTSGAAQLYLFADPVMWSQIRNAIVDTGGTFNATYPDTVAFNDGTNLCSTGTGTKAAHYAIVIREPSDKTKAWCIDDATGYIHEYSNGTTAITSTTIIKALALKATGDACL